MMREELALYVAAFLQCLGLVTLTVGVAWTVWSAFGFGDNEQD